MLSGHGSGGLGKATNQITGRGANEKGGDGSAENHDAHHENPFLQFLSPSWYVLNFQPLFQLFRTLLSVDVLCICTDIFAIVLCTIWVNWFALMKWKTAKLHVLYTLVQCTALLALFPDHSQVLFCSCGENLISPQLWDKIWEWPGNETTTLEWPGNETTALLWLMKIPFNCEILCSNLFQAFAKYYLCESMTRISAVTVRMTCGGFWLVN